MVKREPTSINVNPELWKQAKIEAIKKGITVTELFENALSKELGMPLEGGKGDMEMKKARKLSEGGI